MGIFSLFGSSDKPDLDQLVLTQLKKAGSDLSKPHVIEFFLYFPTQAAAEEAAVRVREDGFQANVEPPLKDTNWLCRATKTMVPDLKKLQDLRSAFERLAWLLKGTYDGWGTSVEK
jgi:Regulator of ribonuclease activity B